MLGLCRSTPSNRTCEAMLGLCGATPGNCTCGNCWVMLGQFINVRLNDILDSVCLFFKYGR